MISFSKRTKPLQTTGCVLFLNSAVPQIRIKTEFKQLSATRDKIQLFFPPPHLGSPPIPIAKMKLVSFQLCPEMSEPVAKAERLISVSFQMGTLLHGISTRQVSRLTIKVPLFF